jgi:hypothetical protein
MPESGLRLYEAPQAASVFRESRFSVQFRRNGDGEVTELPTKEFNGIEYLVVPVIMMVQGVRQAANASLGAELVQINEIAKFPEGWNGRPVVANHPKVGSSFVSANSPDILEAWQIGLVFNAHVDQDKLKAEAWIDKARAEELGGDAEEIVTRLVDGETVEVSTGYFTNVIDESGRFNGSEYIGVQRDIVPDHLAFLDSTKTGACSIEDGCGSPRANEAVHANCTCGGQPVENEQTTEEVTPNADDPKAKKSKGSKGMKKTKVTYQANAPVAVDEKKATTLIGKVLEKVSASFKTNELSDNDKRSALTSALCEVCNTGYVYIIAMYDSEVVYVDWRNSDGQTVMRSYSVAEGGAISIGTEAVQVRPETRFVPVVVTTTDESGTASIGAVMETGVSQPNQEDGMATQQPSVNDQKKAKVDAVIAASNGSFDEKDRDMLMASSEKVLDRLMSPAPAETQTETAPAANSGASTTAQPAANASGTVEDYLKAAPAGVREMLEAGLKLHQDKRTDLITKIKSNSRNGFTDDQLKGFDLPMLENIAKLSGGTTVNFAINGGSEAPRINTSDDRITPAPKVFEVVDPTKKSTAAA